MQLLTKNVDASQLNELHVTAKPVIVTCNSDIRQKITQTVHVAESEWKNINDNIRYIRDKYERSLKLWKKYRDSSNAIKDWAAHRICTINIQKPLDANEIEVRISEHTNNCQHFNIGQSKQTVLGHISAAYYS